MCVLDCCRVRAAAAVVAAHRSLVAMADKPKRPRARTGTTPEKVAKPKVGEDEDELPLPDAPQAPFAAAQPAPTTARSQPSVARRPPKSQPTIPHRIGAGRRRPRARAAAGVAPSPGPTVGAEATAPAPVSSYEARRAAHASAGAAPRGNGDVARGAAAVVRPATSTARFQVGEQVESTVKTLWAKDRGVVVTVINGGRREVVTTTGSVVVLRSSELEQTTLTDEDARLCAATLERLRSSTKDYVQARIDGAIIVRDNDGRQIRNSFESVEDGEALLQFEATETHVRCTLCPGHTWPLETDMSRIVSNIRHHLDLKYRAGPVHRERLVAKASDSSWRTPPLVPVTSTVPFAIGTHVESTVETPWAKDRGVVITETGGGYREVVTTIDSVVALTTGQLVQTTLNVDEVRRCEATRERLRSSTKDYVQARIDGTIVVGDNNGREIRNRFKSVENDEELLQFEATETHVRCALCPAEWTVSLDKKNNGIFAGIRRHLTGRTHRERLVAKASDSSWRTRITVAPVAAPQPLAPVEAPIERERAVLQLQVGGIPSDFFSPSSGGRSQGVVLYGPWHKIDGAEVKGWAWYGLDARDNPPSLLDALPEGSMMFRGKFFYGDDRSPVDKIITGESRGAKRRPDLVEKRMTLRLSVTPAEGVYKVDGDGENAKGDYTILGSAKRSDLCTNQNFTASSDGSTPSTRRLPRRRLRRLPEGAGPDSLVHFVTGSGSNSVWVLELERTYTPKVEEELPEKRPHSPRPSTPMTVRHEYPNMGAWSVPEENYVNGISHLFFLGKLLDVDDGERLPKVLSKLLCCRLGRVYTRIRSTRLDGRQKYEKSDEGPSPVELAALDELKRKFLLDKSLASEEEKSSEPAASSSTGIAMTGVFQYLTAQNRPRVTLKSDGPFELKTMLKRSCLAKDPTRPCLRIKATPLKDEATGETVAQVSLTFEVDAMDLTAAPPDGDFSGSVTTGKRSTFRRYPDRMHLHFEAVEEANTFKVDGYGANNRIGKYRMEGTAVAQDDGLYLDMKRIRDSNAPDLPKPPDTKVCPACEKRWEKGTRICDPDREGCGEPLTESARIQKAGEAYAADPDNEELARTYFDLVEPDRVIFRAVPYPAPLKLRTLLVEGTPEEFLAACALEPYVTRSPIPEVCIKPGYHLRVCKVKNAGVGGCYTHGARSVADAIEMCKVQVAGNVVSSVYINRIVGATEIRFSATTRSCWLDRTVRDRHLHAIDACDVHRHAVEQTSRRWRPSVDVATMV